jgi:ATP-binding cassette, subfamily B, bacterial PglK
MLDTIHKFRDILDHRERRNAVLLLSLILVTGIMEAVGVASVMPFLAVLSNPEAVQKSSFLSFLYDNLNFAGTDSFLLFLGCAVFLVVVVSLCIKSLTEYAIARFSHMRNYSLSTRLLRNYLCRPYTWFLNRHSADLGKSVLSEVAQVINQALMPTAQLIANSVIAFFLIALLLLVNARVALLAAVILGGSYGLIYLFLRKYLSYIGADRVKANRERFQIAQEALGGIKEVKAGGLEAGYLQSFAKPAHRFARRQAANTIIGQIPQFALQAITFGGIIVFTLILLAVSSGGLDEVLPTLGLFAFAGQRLLPALNKIYQNAAKMRFGKPALDAFYADYMERRFSSRDAQELQASRNTPPLGLNQALELAQVEFKYPGADRPALKDLNLRIVANSTVGFVGPTGAGKTTLVDLIMGLLSPDKGEILVDGHPILEADPGPSSSSLNHLQLTTYNSLRSWQRTLGYVPQQIFLADDTVAANIAFGVAQEEIEMEAVKRAARIAELHEFVQQELPQGYETTVGERGVRLSGGQRQRIGIARALYHDPDVLILDEATSALDNLTEKAVMQAVHNLSNKKTIILIAHRLSTVRNCDCIFMLDHGKLAAQGTYSELLDASPEFRKMAAVSE